VLINAKDIFGVAHFTYFWYKLGEKGNFHGGLI
jgi:hypothetical protein